MRSLRVTTSAGVVVREPELPQLLALLAGVEHDAAGGFVVLDGDTVADAPFLQAAHLGAGQWRVEALQVGPARVGGSGRGPDRYVTHVRGAAAVGALFWSWASGSPEWQQRRWEHEDGPAPRRAA